MAVRCGGWEGDVHAAEGEGDDHAVFVVVADVEAEEGGDGDDEDEDVGDHVHGRGEVVVDRPVDAVAWGGPVPVLFHGHAGEYADECGLHGVGADEGDGDPGCEGGLLADEDAEVLA